MSNVSSNQTDDKDEDFEPPDDLVFLLTPSFDIYRRIDPGEFIAFVVEVSQAIDEQFLHWPASTRIEFQTACALLPGRKSIVEFQVQPPDAGATHIKQLAAVLEQMPVPELTAGPVAFFRRAVFGQGPKQAGGFDLPFLRFLQSPGMMLLDDLLMQAGEVPAPSKSLWDRITGFFRGDPMPERAIAEQEIVPSLSKQLGCVVIVCNGRMGVGR